MNFIASACAYCGKEAYFWGYCDKHTDWVPTILVLLLCGIIGCGMAIFIWRKMSTGVKVFVIACVVTLVAVNIWHSYLNSPEHIAYHCFKTIMEGRLDNIEAINQFEREYCVPGERRHDLHDYRRMKSFAQELINGDSMRGMIKDVIGTPDWKFNFEPRANFVNTNDPSVILILLEDVRLKERLRLVLEERLGHIPSFLCEESEFPLKWFVSLKKINSQWKILDPCVFPERIGEKDSEWRK